MTGTCTLSTNECQESPPTCERFDQSLQGYNDVTFGSGNYYLFADFSVVFKEVLKCIADEPSPCAQTEVVIGEDAEVTPEPRQLGVRFGAVLVENKTSLLVVDSSKDDPRVVRCDTSKSPAQCKVILQDPDPSGNNVLHDVAFANAASPTTTTTTTTTNATNGLSFAVFEQGFYCYDAGAAEGMPSTSYRSLKEIESRDECEDLCAADVQCNYYSWYPTTARCDRCVFYNTCKYLRRSVCLDESSEGPTIYKKSSENTTRPVTHRSLVVRADLNGAYCQGTEVLSVPVATQDECQRNCSVVSSCQFVAYYFLEHDKAGPVEDAPPTACNVQCRLFSGCTSTVKSFCYPPAIIWEASPSAP